MNKLFKINILFAILLLTTKPILFSKKSEKNPSSTSHLEEGKLITCPEHPKSTLTKFHCEMHKLLCSTLLEATTNNPSEYSELSYEYNKNYRDIKYNEHFTSYLPLLDKKTRNYFEKILNIKSNLEEQK